MTANQLMNAANNEAIRHNLASEEEIKRHNSTMENIEYDRLQLNQWIESQRIQLQKEYNDAMIHNESYALEIKQQLANAEEWYQTQMATIKYREQAENESWHDVQEQLSLINAKLEDKRIEYQHYENLESNQIKWEDLNVRRDYNLAQIDLGLKNFALSQNTFDMNYLRMQQDYKINLDKMILANNQFDLDLKKWETQQNVMKSQEFVNYMNSITGVFNSATNALIKLGF